MACGSRGEYRALLDANAPRGHGHGDERNSRKYATPEKPTPEKIVADLVFLLNLEAKGPDVFLGRRGN